MDNLNFRDWDCQLQQQSTSVSGLGRVQVDGVFCLVSVAAVSVACFVWRLKEQVAGALA
jgi:hypothetical protein